MTNFEIKSDRPFLYNLFLIFIGTNLLAFSINVFFEPMNLVIGGVTGLAIVIKEVSEVFIGFEIPIWLTNIAVNIPLFLVSTMIKGKDFGTKTVFATLLLTFTLYYTENLPMITTDLMLSTVYGGIIAGAGLGFVFLAFATTGGTDLAASIIQHYVKHFSVAKIMFFIDAFIVLIGAFIFGPEKALYAIIAIVIIAKVIDGILEGLHFSKAALIISDKHDILSMALMQNIERGVTSINGTGMFSSKEKTMLLCVVSKKQIVKLKELVRSIDEKAFVIVTDVKEVLGEGFIEYKQ
ncbi:uncharacterized membrane-anchored protein YitT (DUF2179 family) [Natranaerovirga hydrolytica]|uniref:Uncharacterized membrane-anchored protein YitT (DUF2179 family) n=1 Tax=Natranaerovirga hydrolytica TaxID=680378 RepID=A0A4R1ML39_9FIRM|nr:YitT family protein [Natranaerovirga hydrolytica]TCK93466.1 uncharacterized membrane-anchored protein YitT (DUF2179 family) [Natranaerovirga hydrolytica]